MSKPDLASIFNLKFYRKQKKWRFTRDVVSEDSLTPECSNSARALLNETYNVEASAELPIPTALDEAFIISGNGAELSSGGDGEALSEDPSHPKANLNCSGPPGPPTGPLTLGPPDLCDNTTVIDLDHGKSCPETLHQRPDEFTDLHTSHCDLREEKLQEHGQSANEAGQRDLAQYLSSIGPRRSLQEWDEDLWRDPRELSEPPTEQLAREWPAPAQAAAGDNADQNPDHWMLVYYEAARELPGLAGFQEEEHLLSAAQRWRRAPPGDPPLHCGPDCVGGLGHPDENLLLDLLKAPQDRLLARSPAGPGDSPAGDSPSPPGDSPWADQSLDSERFMLGAHLAPSSSEIELAPGDAHEHSGAPLDALVWRHARALRDLLHLAQTESDRPEATHCGQNFTSAEEFPTREVGLSVPQCPQPAPRHPPAAPQLSYALPLLSLSVRGRGRSRKPVVGLSAGRPYRL